MKTYPSSLIFAIASCFVLFAPKMVAQTNSILLFGPVDVRGSKDRNDKQQPRHIQLEHAESQLPRRQRTNRCALLDGQRIRQCSR